MKDLLRFDTVVAACALLMSTVTAGAMVYQTRVLQDQFSATVWPYLGVSFDYSPASVDVRMINEGVGPALIRSAQVVVDGKPMVGWDRRFLAAVFGGRLRGAKHLQAQMGSVDASTALRAGEDRTIIRVQGPRNVIRLALTHDITLKFCYCSINSRCWNVVDSSQSSRPAIPAMVAECKGASSIEAPVSAL
jgi:hypothetical protein